MRLACLLLLAGCDALFNLDHLNSPPVDAGRDTLTADTEIDAIGAGTTVDEVAGGGSHTCVRAGASLRCFGNGVYGRLGLGNQMLVGDNEYPRTVPFVNVGAAVLQVTAGEQHTCVLTAAHTVRCWGSAMDGRLGYGDATNDIGDSEPPASAGDIDVGMAVDAISAGGQHTCALGAGAVRCWGSATAGRLGYANGENIGDNEFPSSAGSVVISALVTQISAGPAHTCAVTVSKQVYCWGNAGVGRLGYGNSNSIGDNETPESVGPVPTGGTALQVVTGNFHTCALLDGGNVRCWGANTSGQLGTGNGAIMVYGDDEPASVAPTVNVGGAVKQLAAGDVHTCALLTTGGVRCWGQNTYGQLGHANTVVIGDDEAPAIAGDVPLGGIAVAIAAGGSHTCVRLNTGTVRCWGQGAQGRLGYGNTQNVGDTETPSAVGDVPVL